MISDNITPLHTHPVNPPCGGGGDIYNRLERVDWQIQQMQSDMSTIKEKLDHMPLKTDFQTELREACSQLPTKADIWRIAFGIFCGSVIVITTLYSAFS